MITPPMKIELFSGTGGVGKTTLATSRALNLVENNLKVLLITIDPSKRLKQILNILDDTAGQVQSVDLSNFTSEQYNGSLDALLFSPGETLRRVAQNSESSLENPILKTLSKPYGGLNEIMALVELNYQLEQNKYDCIILDTPPGKHFLDFLESSRKINAFFDSTFIEIFKILGRSFENIGEQASKKTPFFSSIINSGVKKLLSYLERVTGKDFVDTFVNAILAIYKCKNAFINSLKLQEKLYDASFTNIFLVTSVEHNKLKEAQELQSKFNANTQSNNFLAINRCQSHFLNNWETASNADLSKIKDSMLDRENKLKDYANGKFEKILEFPEIVDISPGKHVEKLSGFWSK